MRPGGFGNWVGICGWIIGPIRVDVSVVHERSSKKGFLKGSPASVSRMTFYIKWHAREELVFFSRIDDRQF
jgi:hypothetical protein